MNMQKIDLSSAPSLMETRAASWGSESHIPVAKIKVATSKPQSARTTPSAPIVKAPAPKPYVKRRGRDERVDRAHSRTNVEISMEEQRRIVEQAILAFAPPVPSPMELASWLELDMALDLVRARRCTDPEFAGSWELQADAEARPLRLLGLVYVGNLRLSFSGKDVRKFLLEDLGWLQ